MCQSIVFLFCHHGRLAYIMQYQQQSRHCTQRANLHARNQLYSSNTDRDITHFENNQLQTIVSVDQNREDHYVHDQKSVNPRRQIIDYFLGLKGGLKDDFKN